MKPTLHVDEEFGLDTPGRLALVLAARAAEGVYLIYEDDGRFVLSGQREEVLHPPGEEGGEGRGEGRREGSR